MTSWPVPQYLCTKLTWNICQDGRRCWDPWHSPSSWQWSDIPWPPIAGCVSVRFLTPDSAWCGQTSSCCEYHHLHWQWPQHTALYRFCCETEAEVDFWWGFLQQLHSPNSRPCPAWLSPYPCRVFRITELHKHPDSWEELIQRRCILIRVFGLVSSKPVLYFYINNKYVRVVLMVLWVTGIILRILSPWHCFSENWEVLFSTYVQVLRLMSNWSVFLKESKCDIQFLHVCTFSIEQYTIQNMFLI